MTVRRSARLSWALALHCGRYWPRPWRPASEPLRCALAAHADRRHAMPLHEVVGRDVAFERCSVGAACVAAMLCAAWVAVLFSLLDVGCNRMGPGMAGTGPEERCALGWLCIGRTDVCQLVKCNFFEIYKPFAAKCLQCMKPCMSYF